MTGWAARHLEGPSTPAPSATSRRPAAPQIGNLFQSALAFPLIDGDQLIAILTAYHVDEQPYTDAHLRLLERLGGQVASVLANSIQFEGLRAASLTDSLTDLPNSRALIGHVDQRLSSNADGTVPSAIIMIDLDEFKTINDAHGHQTGDLALQTLASTLRRQVRASDFCARYGGDEFIVALVVPGPLRSRAPRGGPAARGGPSGRDRAERRSAGHEHQRGCGDERRGWAHLRGAAGSGGPQDVCGQAVA